jgi:hypothetical protein
MAMCLLSWQKPDYVMEMDMAGERVISYRRVFVYSLLISTSLALLVFGVQYWRASKAVKRASRDHHGHRQSRENSRASTKK